MKEQIIFTNEINKTILSVLKKSKNNIIISFNKNIKEKNINKNITFKLLKDIPKNTFNYEIEDFLEIFRTNIKTKKYMTFDGFDLTSAYYGDATLHLEELIEKIKLLDNITNELSIKELQIYEKDIGTIQILEEISKLKNIKCNYLTKPILPSKEYLFAHYIKPKAVNILKQIRNLKDKDNKPFPKTNRKRIMYLCRERGDEAFFEYIDAVNKLDKFDSIIIKQEPYGRNVSAKKKLDEKNYNYRSFYGYIDSDIKKEIRLKIKLMTKLWTNLKHNKEFQSKIKIGNVNCWNNVKPFVKDFIINRIPEVIQNILISKKIMDVEKPDLYVTDSAFIEFNRDVLWGASKKTKTFAIQGCQFVTTKWLVNRPNTFYDKISLWGEMWGELISTNEKDKNKFVYCGITKYDTPIKLAKKLDLGAETKNKKIITFTTQPILGGIKAEREIYKKTFRGILNTIINRKDIFLIIKPHPGDIDTDMYIEMLKKNNVTNFKVLNPSIYDIVKSSDLVITQFSSSGIDAIYMDKPTLSIVLGSKSKIPIYAKAGAAILVTKEKDIEENIIKLLFDEKVKKELAEKRKKFIKEFCYKNDGKATERTINAMIKTITE